MSGWIKFDASYSYSSRSGFSTQVAVKRVTLQAEVSVLVGCHGSVFTTSSSRDLEYHSGTR